MSAKWTFVTQGLSIVAHPRPGKTPPSGLSSNHSPRYYFPNLNPRYSSRYGFLACSTHTSARLSNDSFCNTSFELPISCATEDSPVSLTRWHNSCISTTLLNERLRCLNQSTACSYSVICWGLRPCYTPRFFSLLQRERRRVQIKCKAPTNHWLVQQGTSF